MEGWYDCWREDGWRHEQMKESMEGRRSENEQEER
jgi:hypothetical protein